MPASGPLTAREPIIGVIATTCSRRAVTASRTPSTARIGSSETNGLEGASMIRSALSIASSTPGAGPRPGDALEAHGADRIGRAAPDQPLLERELAAPA